MSRMYVVCTGKGHWMFERKGVAAVDGEGG